MTLSRWKRDPDADAEALIAWERTFDAIQDPIAIADADGILWRANRAFRRLFGVPEGAGADIAALLYGEPSAGHDELRAGHVTYETSALRVAGTFLVSQSPLELGNGAGVVYHLSDVTALRAAEEEARKSAAQALQVQKMEAVGRLAGGVAHDFNNLLTSVLCNAEILLDRVRPQADLAEPLEQIEEAAQRGAALVRHLLSFSRPKQGRPEVLEVDARIAGLSKILSSLIGEHIHLDLRLGAEAACIRVDPVHLEQILINLAVNARDAMRGGGTLTIGSALSRGDDGNAWVTLAVSDTGTGMDEETRSRALEPFFTTKGEGHGSGLGLATVYSVVKQVGGAIAIDSEVGRGTTVSIRVPAAGGATEGRAPTRERVAVRRDGTGTVLLVEDEEGPRRAIGSALRELGFEVLAAADAGSALDVARRHPGGIDLLLTDVVLPGVSGPELARDIRQAFPATRILLMSGYGSDARRERTGVGDASDLPLLAKPFTLSDLAQRLDQVLGAG